MIYRFATRARHVQGFLTGDAEQWTAASTSQTLRSAAWTVLATPRRFGMFASAHEMSALPSGLQALQLNIAVPMGTMLLHSLCSSLWNAQSLVSLTLEAITVLDFLSVLNGLATRTSHPNATPLQALHVSIADGCASAEQPASVSVAGIVGLISFQVHCPRTLSTPAFADAVRAVADEMLAHRPTTSGMVRFEYDGFPLRNRTAFDTMLAVSMQTMQYLVVPTFCTHPIQPTTAEMCIDRMSRLQALRVFAPEIRLDFVLDNKPVLETIVHMGSVWNAKVLTARLAALKRVRHFHLTSSLQVFATPLYAAVDWPDCEHFSVGTESITTTAPMIINGPE